MAANASKATHRLQYRFWLDVVREDEYSLAEYIDEQKNNRTFAKTIRDALNLIRDLRAGKVDWLLFLFPWVYSAIYAQAEADIIAKQQKPESVDAPQDLVIAELRRLEASILALGSIPIQEGQMPSQTPIPKALPRSVSADLPDFEVAQVAPEKGKAYANYMRSLLGMNTAAKPAPQRAIKPKAKAQRQIAAPPTNEQDTQLITAINEPAAAMPRALSGANIEMAAPSFDDIAVDF